MAENTKTIFYKGYIYQASGTYEINSTPVNLTGETVKFHLRKENKDTDFLTITAGTPSAKNSTLTLTDAANGEFSLFLTDEETAAFNFESGYWHLSRTSGGNVRIFMRRKFKVVTP